MIVRDLHFSDIWLDRVGLHYPNTSGWPGAGISCCSATNVSYANVGGVHLKTPGYFSRCYDLAMRNVSITMAPETMGWACIRNITGCAESTLPAPCPSLSTCPKRNSVPLGTDDDAVAAKPRASGKRPSKPALGFNHCSVECCGPDMPSAAFMTATADAMLSRGLTEAGYEFVNMGKR